MTKIDTNRFENLTYEDFRQLAVDRTLSRYERIGFPNSYRENKEALIFEDIQAKLPALGRENGVVLDIGPGCSDLPHLLIDHCQRHHHELVLVDSAEMLAHLPDAPFITKIEGRFPDCAARLDAYLGRVNTLLCYSVFHYIFIENNLWHFMDAALALLSEGGEMLLGDIPNQSKRNRFFSSPAGIHFHQDYTGTDEIPAVTWNHLHSGKIDDSVFLGMLMRARNAGFDAYWLPQPDGLPMANRREDLLIRRP